MTVDSKSSAYALKTVLVVVGLPLLVLIWGIWQSSRLPSAEWYRHEAGAVQARIDEFTAAQAADPDHAIMVEGAKGKRIPMSQAVGMLRDYKETLEHPGFLEYQLPHVLNFIEVPLAALSMLAGILGLLYIRQLGQHARLSREALLRSFAIGQRVLPWLLGFFSVGVFGTLACTIGFELSRYVETGIDGRVSVKLVIAGGAMILGCLAWGWRTLSNLLAASRAAFEREPITVMGRAISKAEAPCLWAYVANIAKRLETQMPDSIVVGLNEGFFVTEVPMQLASGTTLPAGRALYLPLPYLNFLDKREVAAIIGHELGHFAGKDTQYTQHFAPIYASASENLRAVFASGGDAPIQAYNPVLLLGEFFLRSFHEAVQHWSRLRELAADQIGARVTGAQSAALALLRTCALAPRVEQALYESWQSGGAGAGVMDRVRQLVQENGMEDPAKHLDFTQPHPTDSHPPLRRRLHELGFGQPNETLMARARDVAPSPLLMELGLEAGPAAASQAQAARVAESAATIPAPAMELAPMASLAAAQQGSLGQSLEAEFQQAAQGQREARIAQLRTMAEFGQTTQDLFERRFLGIVAWGIGGVGLILIAILIPPEAGVLLRTAFFLGGPLSLFWAVRNWRLRQNSVLTLEPEGLFLAEASEPLRWTDMADYTIRESSGTLIVEISLEKNYDLVPDALGRRGKYKRKNHTVRFTLGSLWECTNQQFAELMQEHWIGAKARAELAGLST